MPSRLTFGFLLLTLPLALAVGCHKSGSVSENQCRAGDWETLGYRDGVHGLRSTRLLAHQDACGEFGAVPDRETYLRGWRAGIAEFCQEDNGFVQGERGAGYANVCPERVERAFLRGYNAGRELFEARRACARVEGAIAELEARRIAIESELVNLSTAQLDPLLTPTERVRMVTTAKHLIDERVAIEHELPELAEELAWRREELAALERAPAAPAD